VLIEKLKNELIKLDKKEQLVNIENLLLEIKKDPN